MPFYAARRFRPLWLNEFGRPWGAASMLMHHLRTAQFDGVDPKKLRFGLVAELVDRARRGDREDIARAEVELFGLAYAAYVQRDARRRPRPDDLRKCRARPGRTDYRARRSMRPPARIRWEHYIAEMRWMHPLYAPMREAMEDRRFSEVQRHQIWTNLARIRAIPAMPQGRHILVDAASARLWMYEDGRPVEFDESRRRQARAADADDGRLRAPCDPQPVLERAGRPGAHPTSR